MCGFAQTVPIFRNALEEIGTSQFHQYFVMENWDSPLLAPQLFLTKYMESFGLRLPAGRQGTRTTDTPVPLSRLPITPQASARGWESGGIPPREGQVERNRGL